MPFQLGLPEVIVVLVLALLVLGPKRLPEAGRSLGKGIREFKDGIAGHNSPSTHSQAPALDSPRPYTPPPAYVPHADQIPPAEK
jgi:sec-independent protein translocase protein TatA